MSVQCTVVLVTVSVIRHGNHALSWEYDTWINLILIICCAVNEHSQSCG